MLAVVNSLDRKELPSYLPVNMLPSVKKRKSQLNVSASKINDVRILLLVLSI